MLRARLRAAEELQAGRARRAALVPALVFTITGVRISPFMLCCPSPVHTFNAQQLQTDNVSQQTLHFGLEHAIPPPPPVLLMTPLRDRQPHKAACFSPGQTAQTEGKERHQNSVLTAFLPTSQTPRTCAVVASLLHSQFCSMLPFSLPAAGKLFLQFPVQGNSPGRRSDQGLQACSRF